MPGVLVPDLGLHAEIWLLLTVLTALALFFKFQRFWSIRNLDLLLLFCLAPGLVRLVGLREVQPWWAFVWLFLGTLVWLVRCLLDLGLARRPLLEPNLNTGGLACFVIGLLGMVLIETIIIPEPRGVARNPADPVARAGGEPEAAPASASDRAVEQVLRHTPPPRQLKRAAAALGHLAIALGLIALGWRHFERPATGLAMALMYLILPYTRIALIDSGQLVPAALVVGAHLAYRRPLLAGALLGSAAAWMPATVGLVPLWAGAFWGRGTRKFLAAALAILASAATLAVAFPSLGGWARGLGARTLAEAGLLPTSDAPSAGSFWTGVDPAYRLPVLVGYLALVVLCSVWPTGKNLGQLIALSAALLVASQFWYLEEGGTLIVLYLPVVLLMVFRPNLVAKRPGRERRAPRRPAARAEAAAH